MRPETPLPRPFVALPLFALAFALAVVAACGQPASQPAAGEEGSGAESLESAATLEVRDAQVNLLPADIGAVYLTVVNSGSVDDRLLRVETPMAERAETHETVDEDGMMRMVPRPDGFAVPAGGTLVLSPGGKHVMLLAPRVPAGDDTVLLTLHFERAGALEVEASVQRMGAMDHDAMDHRDDVDHGAPGAES
jgi:copper(I)-binding protein